MCLLSSPLSLSLDTFVPKSHVKTMELWNAYAVAGADTRRDVAGLHTPHRHGAGVGKSPAILVGRLVAVGVGIVLAVAEEVSPAVENGCPVGVDRRSAARFLVPQSEISSTTGDQQTQQLYK